MRYEVRSEVPEDENGWPTGAAMWEVFDTHNGEAAKFGEDSFADVTDWADRLNNGTANRHDLLWTPPQKNTLPNPSPEIVEAVEPPESFVAAIRKYRVVSDSRSASARWGVEHIPDGRTAWFGPHKGSAEFALGELVSKNLDPDDMYLWSPPEEKPEGPRFIVVKHKRLADSWGVYDKADDRTAWFGDARDSAHDAAEKLNDGVWETERLSWRDGK